MPVNHQGPLMTNNNPNATVHIGTNSVDQTWCNRITSQSSLYHWEIQIPITAVYICSSSHQVSPV